MCVEFSAAESVDLGASVPPGGHGSFDLLSRVVVDATYRRFLIPPLQRGPVWGLSDQRRLLGSVLAGRPIGALLTVDRITEMDGSDAVPLGMRIGIDRRSIQGQSSGPSGARFVLDGQQRLIALASAFTPATKRQGRPLEFHSGARVWILDLLKLLELRMAPNGQWNDPCAEFEKSLQAKQAKRDSERAISAPEWAAACIKAAQDGRGYRIQLGMLLVASGRVRDGMLELMTSFVRSVGADAKKRAEAERICSSLRAVAEYRIPVFRIARCTALEAASIFERINQSGESLTSGHVASAHIFVRDIGVRRHLMELAVRCDEEELLGLAGLGEGELLLAAICAGTAIGDPLPSLRSDAVLRLVKRGDGAGMSIIKRGIEQIDDALEVVSGILHENGIRDRGDWPVPPVGLALIATLARHPSSIRRLSAGANRARLSRWWWEQCLSREGVSASHTSITRFCQQLERFAASGEPPTDNSVSWSLSHFRLAPSEVKSGAQAKALRAFLRMRVPRDFRAWGARQVGAPLDLHHVFPKAWLAQRGLLARGDCFTNLALVDEDTNRNYIRALPPSKYVLKILEEAGASADSRHRLSEVLAQHGIDIDHLERDDFESFMSHRERWFDGAIRELGNSLRA